MTYFLLFAAVVLAGVVAVLAVEPRRKGGREAGPARLRTFLQGAVPVLDEPDPRLPAVLLPDHPDAADVARLRLSVAPRGYRMDQVDEVLIRLGAALAERDDLITRLSHSAAARPDSSRPAGARPDAARQDPA